MAKKKLLIVDDEKDFVDTLSERLGAKGFDILTAFNGNDGLEKANSEKPDLIILDLMLPKMDGYKVCGLLKNDTRYAKIPIVMFTARAQDSDLALAGELGASAYITKPFDPKLLLGKIKELLGE